MCWFISYHYRVHLPRLPAHRPFIRGRLGFTRLSTNLQGPQNAHNNSILPTGSPFPSNTYASTPTILPPINSSPQVPLSNFHKIVSQQPLWIRHLLLNLHNNLPYPDILNLLIDETKPMAACDGSVLESQGTFGWVLATSNPPRTLLSCSGPAYGYGMDSFRAEAYGILSLLTLLHLLSTQSNQPLPPISIWCDNQAVVNTINKITHRKRPSFPNDTIRPSWDIIQAVCTRFCQHPNLTIQHVKGHQDSQGDVKDLPFQARLNIEADKLAASFQHQSSHVEDIGPMIPGTGCRIKNNFFQVTNAITSLPEGENEHSYNTYNKNTSWRRQLLIRLNRTAIVMRSRSSARKAQHSLRNS